MLAVRGTYCLRPLEHWDRGFESHSRYGCVSAFFCVVLSCVWVEDLRRADPPSKESYQLSNRLISFSEIVSELEQAKRPNPWNDDDDDDDDEMQQYLEVHSTVLLPYNLPYVIMFMVPVTICISNFLTLSEHWGEYTNLRKTKCREAGEDGKTRILIISPEFIMVSISQRMGWHGMAYSTHGRDEK
jgi:hypothetical protein